jgi:hypothetical protein
VSRLYVSGLLDHYGRVTATFSVFWYHHGGAVVVVAEGLLDAVSYSRLRTAMVKAAADEPRAVIVDVDRLQVDSQAALALFPAVATELATWPGLPLLLVATGEAARLMLADYRMPRLVPVYDDLDAAVDAIGDTPPRQIARLALPNGHVGPRLARAFVRRCCYRWRIYDDRALDAIWLANELVENTMKHTYSAATVRLELRRGLLTVAVYDDDPAEPWLAERAPVRVVHGLTVVARLCRTWGTTPTPTGGKVVWAVL